MPPGEKTDMENKNVDIDFPTEIIPEGEVKIRVPQLSAFVNSASEYAPSKAPVFFNPVMELNRDIAVLALQAYQEMVHREISVCEPLTGCGVRGIRFAAEVEGVKKVVINDLNPQAFQLANHNVHINELTERVVVKNEDANFLLASYGAPRNRFDAVDIDPFGPPVPYLDSAIRALRSGSLLMLTATDMAPLCGVHPKACLRKYGGKPLHTQYCKELAVRLLGGRLAVTAAKYDMGVNIIFSHSTAHYTRMYATVEHGAQKANVNIENMGYILHCFNCLHREAVKDFSLLGCSQECVECGSKMNFAGPLWLGRIVDKRFCKRIEEEAKQRPFNLGKRIQKMLTLIQNELEGQVTYYGLDKLCSKLALPMISVQEVIQALRREGFQASLTHFDPTGIKSNASVAKIKAVLRRLIGGK